MSLTLIMLMLCGIPFAFIQLMPGKRSFAILSTIYLCFMAYGYYDTHRPIINDHGDGPGAVFGLIFFILICYGAVAGIITKAITLYMASKNITLLKRTAVRLAGLLLIPCFFYGPLVIHNWEQRLPSSDCNYDIITFSISGEKFKIPGLEIISAIRGNGRDNPSDLTNFFSFYRGPSFRKFCAEFNNGKTPAEVNAVNFRLNEIARAKNDPRFATLCTKAGWPAAICNYSGYYTPEGYPEKIGIYDATKFNAGFMGGGWTYKRIKEDMVKATTPSDIPGFAFDGHNYLWVETNPEPENIPYALNCFKSGKGLYCTSDEPWSGNVYITYGVNISLANPIQEARNIRQTTIEFIKQLNIK